MAERINDFPPFVGREVDAWDVGSAAILAPQRQRLEKSPRHSVIERDFETDGRPASCKLKGIVALSDQQFERQMLSRVRWVERKIRRLEDGFFIHVGSGLHYVPFLFAE